MSDRKTIEFLNRSTNIICWNCDGILENPMKLACGHRVCKLCLVNILDEKEELVCQADQCKEKSSSYEVIPDLCCRREIQNANIYCTNKKNGCQEVMLLKDLEEHTMQKCQFNMDESTKGYGISNMKEGQESDSESSSITSIREDYMRVKENQRKTRTAALRKQNDEITEMIKLVHVLKNRQKSHSQMVASLESRLDQLDFNEQYTLNVVDDGELVWRIPNYSQMRREITGAINSPPFYNGCFGYKMCGKIYLNRYGDGQGTHLSFFFVIMKGKFDALLPWPFHQRVTLTLLDQDTKTDHWSETFDPNPDSSSFTKPVSEMNVACGIPDFVSHNRLETPTYLKDDTILLKIKVDVTDSVGSFQGQANNVECEEEEGN